MSSEDTYGLLEILLNYTSQKDKEGALEEFLNYCYDNSIVDINEFYRFIECDYEEETWLLKRIKRFIKEQGIEEEEDYEW